MVVLFLSFEGRGILKINVVCLYRWWWWGGIILLLRFEIRKGLKVFFVILRLPKTLTQGGWLVFDSLHTLEKRVLQRHLALNQSIIKCNDPSAGSPTDTLLRLLLPLNDTIWGGSNSQPLQAAKTPHYSLNHSIGNSDGRCVQRPETYSMPVDDRRLLGIPRSRRIITIVYPQHYSISKISQSSRIRGSLAGRRLPTTHKTHKKLIVTIIVARERPRTSESITDLLSPQASSV